MELHYSPVVPNLNPTSNVPCPKCHAHMEPFDGADVKDRNYRGLLCPKCRFFKGTRSMGYGMKRVGHRSDGNYDEPFEGKIRPRGS